MKGTRRSLVRIFGVVGLVVLACNDSEHPLTPGPCPLELPANPTAPPLPVTAGDLGRFEGMAYAPGVEHEYGLTLSLEQDVGYKGRTYHRLTSDADHKSTLFPAMVSVSGDTVFAVNPSDTMSTPSWPDSAWFWDARRASLPWPMFNFAADSGSVVVFFFAERYSPHYSYIKHSVVNHGRTQLTIDDLQIPDVYHFEVRTTTFSFEPCWGKVESRKSYYIRRGIGLLRYSDGLEEANGCPEPSLMAGGISVDRVVTCP
jgi:hypothetical protein